MKYGEAVPLARRILEIRARTLGPAHWETADAKALVETLQRVAALAPNQQAEVNATYEQIDEARQLYAREKFTDCLRLLNQALEVRQMRLGPDARETVACMNNLAMVLGSLGKYQEAQTYYDQAAKGLQRSLGEYHPGMATAYSNLALNLQELHRLDEALTYQEKALVIVLRTVGPEEERTAEVRNNLGMILDALERHTEARPHYEEALPIVLRIQGEKSLGAIRIRGNLAANSMHRADYRGAESAFRRVLGWPSRRERCFRRGNTEVATAADEPGRCPRPAGEIRRGRAAPARVPGALRAQCHPKPPGYRLLPQ